MTIVQHCTRRERGVRGVADDCVVQFGAAGMDMLTRIKRGLDPNDVLCPGKLGLPAS